MSTTTTTTTTTTRTYTPTPTVTMSSNTPAKPGSVAPSISTSSSSGVTTTTTAKTTTAATSRVRFDAECVLIPDLGLSGSKRPRMVTKSYSLPLWKKSGSTSKEKEKVEDDEGHVVLKVALPSFKSRKSSSSRSLSRSPPPIAPTLPSCLRSPSAAAASPPPTNNPTSPSDVDASPSPAPSFSSLGAGSASGSNTSDTSSAVTSDNSPSTSQSHDTESSRSPTPTPLAPLPAIYTTITTTSATVSAPLSAAPPNAAARERTVPLRPCCPECAAGRKMEVVEEAFSRGALRVRRRAATFGMGAGVGSESLFEAAQRGGFLDISAAAAAVAAASSSLSPLDGEKNELLSGTGLAQVNRLVAELERRRSATPSPGGTPPVDPSGQHGRASPSLLGPALARIADPEGGNAYGERLSAGGAHGRSGSGRASPLLPLGIAVDEVDKERRRRSEDLGVLGCAGVIVLGEEDDVEEEEGRQRKPHHRSRTPSPQILYDRATSSTAGFPFPSPSSSIPSSAPATSLAFSASTAAAKRSYNAPVPGYVDDDDAELFPLPSTSASGTPKSTPPVSPRGSPAASASDVNVSGVGVGVNAKRLSRGSPKPGALLPAALTGAAREREGSTGSATSANSKDGKEKERSTPPPSPRDWERRAREKSRSEAVCVALGSVGRREREERERAMATQPSGSREPKGSEVTKCARGLLLPPGDERECSDSGSNSGSGSREGSREGSIDRGSGSGSDAEALDLEKPLPVLPRLATSVLAAGPYSPALAPRSYKDDPHVQGQAQAQGKGSHLRVASAPADVPVSSASPSTPTPISTPTASSASSSATTPTGATTSTSAHPVRAKSASTSSSVSPTTSTAASTRAKSGSTSTPAASATSARAPTPSSSPAAQPQALRRVSSFKRLRSASASSAGKSGGRKAFGALVDVLKGVTSMSSGAGSVVV